MRNLAIAAGLLLTFSLVAGPAVLADTTEIQDNYLSISGPGVSLGTSSEYSPSGSGTGYSYTSTGFDSGGGFTSSAYGSYTVTLTAASSGTYQVAAYFDVELNLPFFNEYAVINGTAAAGQSYEVGTGNTACPPCLTQTATDALNNSLNNINGVPMGTDNYSGTGTNGDVAFAMNFSENLIAGDVETVTFTISQTSLGGFNIEQVHPVDGLNPTQLQAFFSGTESVVAPGCTVNCTPPPPPPPPPPPGVPEPGSLMLLGTALCGLLGFAKKFAN